jgi:hypothetical protein
MNKFLPCEDQIMNEFLPGERYEDMLRDTQINGDARDEAVMYACFQASMHYGPENRNRAKAFVGMSEADVAAIIA